MSSPDEGVVVPDEDATLSGYERVKFELADLLRALPWTASRAERLRTLFARLAEDRFNLVVVGRFSRGKSSLMNALLGHAWLPTGILPLTSVITAVAHGGVPGVVLHHTHTSLTTEVPLEALEAHVTERGNPGNRDRVRVAEVRLPAELLRRGFFFVDTPGLGSSVIENTRTTEAFLPEADALLLVTSFDSPLSEEELAVLRVAREAGRTAFVAVNKADAASEAEQAEVMRHLDRQLQSAFGIDMPPVFAVSARDGLAARLAGDAATLAASGLPALEEALVGFLLRDKRRDFLRLSCDRVAAMLAEDPTTGPAQARLRDLQARLTADAPNTAALSVPPLPPPTASVASCTACETAEREVFEFLTRLQGRLRRDPHAREALARAGGLCGLHAWQLAGLAAPRELCIGLGAVLDVQAHALRRVATTQMEAGAMAHLLATPERCPACSAAAAAERGAIATMAAAGAAPGAPCLPHLAWLTQALPEESAIAATLAAAERLVILAEDARRFALRQDAARPDLGNPDDRAIGVRVVAMLVGREAVLPRSPAPADEMVSRTLQTDVPAV